MKRFSLFVISFVLPLFFLSVDNIYALTQQDLQTVQNGASIYQATPQSFTDALTALQDATLGNRYTIDQLRTVATIREDTTTVMGGPDGNTPTQVSSYTVTAVSPAVINETNNLISYYRNTIIPQAYSQYQAEAAAPNLELRSIQAMGAYLRPRLSSPANLAQGVATSLFYRSLTQREPVVRNQVATGLATPDSSDPSGAGDAAAITAAAAAGSAAGLESATLESQQRADAADVSGRCTTLWNATFVSCIDVFFAWVIKNWFIKIATVFLWATASLLNLVIQQGILNFSQWAPDALYPIWVVVRQIVSLFVIFAGLWLGFMYIIGKGDEFKKYIPWIVMFGLFVNFSYPLTRSLIDISNVVSLNIYASAVGTQPIASVNGDGTGTAGETIIDALGLGVRIRNVTKNSDTLATSGGVDSAGASMSTLTQANSVPVALLVFGFVLYTCWVFLVASGILIMRTVGLVFLIVASPILFVDSVLPKLGDEAMKLRKFFFSQLIVAPVFMIMLALTLKFLEVFRGVAPTNGADIIRNFLNMTMMLVMMHITLKVTKEVAGSFGNYMTKTIGQVGAFAGTAAIGVATGGTGLIARGTIGRAAMAARDSGWVERNQNSFIGRRAYDLSNSLASSTYDARNSTLLKSGASKLGISMGMGTKFGYEASLENRRKDREARYGRIQQTFKQDAYDPKTGELLHKKGDMNEAGVKAAVKFKESEGGATVKTGVLGTLNKAEKVILNKQANDEIFEKSIKESVDKMMKGYRTDPTTGKAKTEKEKKAYMEELRAEKDKIKKIDPMMQGEYAQTLIETMKKIDAEKADEELSMAKKVNRLFDQYNATDPSKQARFKADIEDDAIRQALQDKIDGKPSAAGTVTTSSATPAQNTSAPLQSGPSWAGQGNTNIPAMDRKNAAKNGEQNSATPVATQEAPASSAPERSQDERDAQMSNIMSNFNQLNLREVAKKPVSQVATAASPSAENDGVYTQTPKPAPSPSSTPV